MSKWPIYIYVQVHVITHAIERWMTSFISLSVYTGVQCSSLRKILVHSTHTVYIYIYIYI